MASPRITKTMREGIVANTIEHTFKAEAIALAKQESKLALAAYVKAYDKPTIKAMNQLGDNFVESSTQMTINLGGQRHHLAFGGGLSAIPYEYNSRNILRELVKQKHPEARRFVKRSGDLFVPDSILGGQIQAHIDQQIDLYERSRKASVALTAMLESVQSFKKLRAVWPEGVKFYDMYDVDTETKAGVPAVVVTQLNALLGIK